MLGFYEYGDGISASKQARNFITSWEIVNISRTTLPGKNSENLIIILWSTVLQKLTVTISLSRNSSPFMETESLLPCAQEPATVPCSEPYKESKSSHRKLNPFHIPPIHTYFSHMAILFGLFNRYFVCVSLISHAFYIPRPYDPSGFDNITCFAESKLWSSSII